MAIILNNIGESWLFLGDAQKALEYFEESLRIDKKNYGDEYPHIALVFKGLGKAWQQLKDVPKTSDYFEKSLQIFKITRGDTLPDTKAIAAIIAKINSERI